MPFPKPMPPTTTRLCLFSLAFCFALPAIAAPGAGANGGSEAAVASAADGFVPNRGQWSGPFSYRTPLPGGALFLTAGGAFRYSFYSTADLERIHELRHDAKNARPDAEPVRGHAYEMRFAGGAAAPQIAPGTALPHYHNYYLGANPEKWATTVPVHGTLDYKGIYPGIDVHLSRAAASGGVKWDLIVAPGADPSTIRLEYNGVRPQITKKGELLLRTSVGDVAEGAPYTYQMVDGKNVEVPCRYVLAADGTVSFSLPQGYRADLPLVIDPTLVFKTYSGSTYTTYGFSAAHDPAGNLYSGGEVFGTGWPVTTGAFQTTFGGGFVDVGINKYNPAGTALLYSTYFGGSGGEVPVSMVCNAAGELAITGTVTSTNMPVTVGAFQPAYAGGGYDFYVARFNAAGSALLGSTYVGGTGDEGYGTTEIIYNAAGDLVVAASTASSNFPTSTGAYQTTFGGSVSFWGGDGVVFSVNPTCTALGFSTYLGGSDLDRAVGLWQMASGDYAVTGETQSTNFPTTAGVMTPASPTAMTGDAFVSILNGTGTALLHSTYLGTTGSDGGFRIQAGPGDSLWVMGTCDGSLFPVSPGAYSNPGSNIFIAKLTPTLSALERSTVIGGGFLIPDGFLLDICGNVYFSGYGASSGLPTTPGAYQTTPGGFWLCVLSNNISALHYATYMGAPGDHIDGGHSRFDPMGIVYHSVCSSDPSAYAMPGKYAPTKLTSSYDIASFRFDFESVGVFANITPGPNDSGCAPYAVTFSNGTTGIGGTSYTWDFGDGSPASTATSPTHTYTAPGTYTVKLVAFNGGVCAGLDTAYTTVTVLDGQAPELSVTDTTICVPGIFELTAHVGNLAPTMSFAWTSASPILSSSNAQTITVDPTPPASYTVTVTNNLYGVCSFTATGTIRVERGQAEVVWTGDTVLCPGDTVTLQVTGSQHYAWYPPGDLSDDSAATILAHPYYTTTYFLLGYDDAGCRDSATVTLHVDELPDLDAGAAVVMRYGTTVEMRASGATNYTWSPATGLSSTTGPMPSASPRETITYTVTTTTPAGCVVEDTVRVVVTNASVPTAFTPNGDGRNDVFRVYIPGEGVVLQEFAVFNRYGQRVFVTKDILQGWNGVFEGKLADVGTYFWVALYSIGLQTYAEKGDVALIR